MSVGAAVAVDPAEALEALAAARDPMLIGVRHHSPMLAAAMPALLDAFRPELILVELPEELGEWLKWLGDPGLEAPVALAGVRDDDGRLGFYPFADFSPELAAVRWATAHGVAVEPCDLPIAAREDDLREPDGLRRAGAKGLLEVLQARAGADGFEELWDRLVEARARPGADPEAVRRAALLLGWALRVDAVEAGGVAVHDLRREAHMRARLDTARATGRRTVVVVGAFHAAALLEPPRLFEPAPPSAREAKPAKVVTSMIPYSSELLDSRSGYPAGIRDPLWQQAVWSAAREQRDLEGVVAPLVVNVCREVRALGHVAGVPDASEAVRLAMDLARLRGLPAPGRREVLEAVQSALGRGELLGRGRTLARALERVLVGRQRGRLPLGAPRSGLLPHVEGLLAALSMPGPTQPDATTLRLDPLRSAKDRERHVVLERLAACGVPYGTRREGRAAGGVETLGAVWEVEWTPTTEAMLELAGTRGVTLVQAVRGALVAERARLDVDERLTARARLNGLSAAAVCGLLTLVVERLEELMGPFLAEASLVEVIDACALVEQIERGHVPALPRADDGASTDAVPPFALPPTFRRAELVAAALRALDGLAGSDRVEDARALLDLARLFEAQPEGADALGPGVLRFTLDRFAREGAPLIQGAAGAAGVLLGHEAAVDFGKRLGSWVDAAVDLDSRRALARRLQGALTVAAPRLESDPTLVADLADRVEAIDDDAFLARVPALREGFDALSPAARERLLSALGERAGAPGRVDLQLDDAPELLEAWAVADRRGREAVVALGGGLLESVQALAASLVTPAGAATPVPPAGRRDHALPPHDRWRLVLGRQRDRLCPQAGRVATALDQLYGAGHGEGSQGEAGGHGPGFPSVRDWAGELEDVFGASVREEVLARAAERGLPAAALELDPESVTPSVALLEQILSLPGGLSELQLARLRRLVARVVDQLVQELAVRVRPALAGLTTPRPTRRRGGPLDLRRTIEANLKTIRHVEGCRPQLVPERLVFRTRARRSLDWHVILVVDVSGSMEASVIHSAIMAAIVAGLPAFTVKFLAFSDDVIDLSERVADPLGLLLEVSVGGGTHIARALRHARELITVPARTIVVVVTDFEEGRPLGNLVREVRALVETGAHALGLAALDEGAQPRYNRAAAELVVAAGMPVAALTPLELARWIGEKVRG